MTDYNFVDIGSCFWSRYFTESDSCSFKLPEFVLEDLIPIDIGANLNQNSISIVPFE